MQSQWLVTSGFGTLKINIFYIYIYVGMNSTSCFLESYVQMWLEEFQSEN